MSDELSPQPEATTEEPELIPGGTDALSHDEGPEADIPVARDPDPEKNPATDDQPAEISSPEDKQQEGEETAADEGAEDSDESGTPTESATGQSGPTS